MKSNKYYWKLQENIIDKDNTRELINFIRTTKRYTQFEKVKQFENEWSKWEGCKYSVFVNSGSSANLVIISVLKELFHWEMGDEIIVPAVTWPTDISSVIQLGLKPVFIDINLNDFSIDAAKLAEKITSKTKAVFLTHLIGFPADIERIRKIIGKKIILIEDCCESQGATINGKKIGNFGIASSFSLYWGHHMTSVEGGMICTNNEQVYKLALLKRSHGLARELPEEHHSRLKKKFKDIDFRFLFLTDGYNVRNTELAAVLGISQLKKIDNFIRIRNKNYFHFLSILKKYKKYFIVSAQAGISSFVLPFIARKKEIKESLQAFLTEQGIESRPIISGNILKQPFLRKYYSKNGYPIADFVHDNGFYIGNNQFVNKQRLIFLEKSLKDFFNKYE